MSEIILSERAINRLINKGEITTILDGKEVIIRQSYQKELAAELINWDKQIADVSQNIVRNKLFESPLQRTM